jgi:triacylglycerol lipase
MLATLQRTTTLILVAFVAGWAVWWIGRGRFDMAPIGLALIAAAYAGILGLEFLLLRRSYRNTGHVAPTSSELLSSWLSEVSGTPRVFLWRQPFRSRAHGDFLPAAPGSRRGLVLVHGFICNRGLWNPWMRRLREVGIPFVAVNLEPVFGSIDRYADSLEQAVEALERTTGQAPVIVAHSMGGLAVRHWLSRFGRDGRVHRIVTIATPHAGTQMARHGLTRNASEMHIGSDWLQALAEREDPAWRSKFTCFWGHCDNVVFPTQNATLPGADNRHLPATPHVQMVFHPDVFEEVLRWVADRSERETDRAEGAVSEGRLPARCSGPDARSPPLTG